jgi:hypothetical protein
MTSEFPAELLEEARSKPGCWVYAIDPGYAPDGGGGRIPSEDIIGAWNDRTFPRYPQAGARFRGDAL